LATDKRGETPMEEKLMPGLYFTEMVKYDGVVKSPIYCVAAHFEILDILYV
jgi:hypothetical protein